MPKSEMHNDHNFSFCQLPKIEKQVLRMGIAGNYGMDSSDIEWAADQGANYWLWGTSFKKVTSRPVSPSQREIKANPHSRSAKLRVIEKVS